MSVQLYIDAVQGMARFLTLEDFETMTNSSFTSRDDLNHIDEHVDTYLDGEIIPDNGVKDYGKEGKGSGKKANPTQG